MLPIPRKLVKQGVRDMLRLSDARMSGTSYGAILHVSPPEAHVGGPLALVRTGDIITVDIPARRITLDVSDEELALRRALCPSPSRASNGAMAGCSRSTFARPMKAATSTSLRRATARPWPADIF